MYQSWLVGDDYEVPTEEENLTLYFNLFFAQGKPHPELPLQETLDVAMKDFKFTPF